MLEHADHLKKMVFKLWYLNLFVCETDSDGPIFMFVDLFNSQNSEIHSDLFTVYIIALIYVTLIFKIFVM